MKVVLDARYLNAPGSGIGTYTANLLDQLLQVDQTTRYGLVTREPGLAERFDSTRCEDIVFSAPPRSNRTTYLLGRRLNKMAFDVYHSPFNILPSYLLRPSVVTIHDIIPLIDLSLIDTNPVFKLSAGRFWRRRMIHAAERATRIVTVSETSAAAVAEYFGPQVAERTVVTGSGISPFFLEAPGDEEDAIVKRVVGGSFPYVLTVGQGSPRKNHARALQAFAEAFGSDSPIHFVLVRRIKRPDRAFDRLLRDTPVRDRVIVVGRVNEQELRALYRSARAFFFPSIVEGFGLPIIEAMASDCPVVTTDHGATAEVAGDAAQLCSPFDIAEMAQALRAVVNDDELRTSLIDKGRRRVTRFDYRQCAERTLAVYRQLAR